MFHIWLNFPREYGCSYSLCLIISKLNLVIVFKHFIHILTHLRLSVPLTWKPAM